MLIGWNRMDNRMDVVYALIGWNWMEERMARPDVSHLIITTETLKLVAQIDEFKGAWRAMGRIAPERSSALRRVATIESRLCVFHDASAPKPSQMHMLIYNRFQSS